MTRRRAIIELSASGVTLSVFRGGVVESTATARFDRAEWPEPWTAALPEVEAALAPLVVGARAVCVPTVLVSSIPGAVCAVSGVPRVMPIAHAEASARLELASATGFADDGGPSATVPLCDDAPSASSPQRHLLSAGDTEANLIELEGLVTRCGLRCVGVVPHDAVATIAAAEAVRAAAVGGGGSGGESVTGTAAVWVGEHSSVLALGAGGRLLLVRPVPLGLAALSEAITRPLRSFGGEGSPGVTLTREQARAVVASVGVPGPDDAVPGHAELRGASLLPHVQPALQRLSVEIKQSLRFALGAAARDGIGMRLLGAGAGVPGLADALSRLTGLNVMRVEGMGDRSASVGACAERAWHRLPRLMTRDASARVALRFVRGGVLIGSALALALLGGEWLDAAQKADGLRSRLSQLTASASGDESASRDRMTALGARVATAGLDARVRKAIGDGPDAGAALIAVARAIPERVRVSSIELVADASPAKLAMRAQVRLDEGVDASALVRAFIEKLGSMPVFAGVKLGATQRTGLGGGAEAQTFEVTCELVAIPAAERVADVEGRW